MLAIDAGVLLTSEMQSTASSPVFLQDIAKSSHIARGAENFNPIFMEEGAFMPLTVKVGEALLARSAQENNKLLNTAVEGVISFYLR